MHGQALGGASNADRRGRRLGGILTVLGLGLTLGIAVACAAPRGANPATWQALSAPVGARSRPAPATGATGGASDWTAADEATVISQLGGATAAVTVDGGRAFVGIGPRLAALDVGGPAPRLLVLSEPFAGLVADVAVMEGGLAVAHETGLSVVAFDDQDGFAVRGMLPVTATVVRSVSDGVAYVIDGAERLSVVDVADAESPRMVATLDAPRAVDVEVAGHFAYAIDATHLHVLDASRPATPVLIASLDLSAGMDGAHTELAVAGNRAFVSGWFRYDGQHFTVVDISDPWRPVTVGRWGTGLEHMAGVGGLLVGAWIGGGQAGIVVLDVTQPGEPRRRSSAPIQQGWPTDIALAGDQVLVTIDNQGLQSFTVDLDPAVGTLTPGGLWSPVGPAMDVVANGGQVHLLEGYPARGQRLRRLDTSDPRLPVARCAVAVGENRSDLAATANFVFLGGIDSIVTVDVGGPDCPAASAAIAPVHPGLDPESWWVDLAADGDRLFGLSQTYNVSPVKGQNALVILRVVAGGALDVLSVLPLAQRPTAIDVVEGIAYVLESTARYPDSGRLTIVDVADPLRPRVQGQLAFTGYPYAVIVSGDVAYVAADELSVVDVSDPAHPRVRATLPPSVGHTAYPALPRAWFGPLALAGNRLFVREVIQPRVGLDEHALRVVDVSDPDRPKVVSSLRLPGPTRPEAAGLAAADGVVWLAQAAGGLYCVATPPQRAAVKALYLPVELR